MAIILFLTAVIIFILIFLSRPVFGYSPKGKDLERIRKSPNYRDGKFQNQLPTEVMTEGAGFFKVIREIFLKKHPHRRPESGVPSIKKDLLDIESEFPVITWFGHSSYMIRIKDLVVLVDPVFSQKPSPVNLPGPGRFEGTNIYSADDLPTIDILLITHDHYDHLDFNTIENAKEKFTKVIVPLGVGAHLKHWGIPEEKITELDWDESVTENDIQIICSPTRHFSGRRFKRNKTLWCSFILKTSLYNFYLGGDSGYGPHFKKIGEQYGPFDLAFLDCGQYNPMWPYIHMHPEEVVQATIDLKAKCFMPLHWEAFILSTHRWKEPAERVTAEAAKRNVCFYTPLIGQGLVLTSDTKTEKWWEGVE